MNQTDAVGLKGTLLATPPGSCTGVPEGLAGHCNTRAAAAVDAWINGNFSSGGEWSDLRESSVTPTEKFLRPPEPPTDIGTSWIPEYCPLPSCGHLLKGDVIFIDENGDGKFDDTWIDDGDGIRETGEVDRLRADQFAWGATSTILDFNRLGKPSDPQMVRESAVTPPGLSRARVRVALGEELDCIFVTNRDCVLDGVVETPGSIADDLSNPNNRSSIRDNNEFFGVCDPDRFSGTLDSIQLQVDNCLWKVGSTPVTAPKQAAATGDPFAVRQNWIDQRIIKYTASSTPNAQDFVQNWLVHYSFQRGVPLDESLYENLLILEQTDVDTDPTINVFSTPDTYDATFRIQHTTLGRAYGENFSGDPIGPDPGDTPLDVSLIGKTNPTTDPFWGADSGPLGFNTNMNTNAKSGVGEETGFKFLYAQNVEGFLASCLDCGEEHPFTIPGEPIHYDQVFPRVPEIDPGIHPPNASQSFNIIP